MRIMLNEIDCLHKELVLDLGFLCEKSKLNPEFIFRIPYRMYSYLTWQYYLLFKITRKANNKDVAQENISIAQFRKKFCQTNLSAVVSE